MAGNMLIPLLPPPPVVSKKIPRRKSSSGSSPDIENTKQARHFFFTTPHVESSLKEREVKKHRDDSCNSFEMNENALKARRKNIEKNRGTINGLCRRKNNVDTIGMKSDYDVDVNSDEMSGCDLSTDPTDWLWHDLEPDNTLQGLAIQYVTSVNEIKRRNKLVSDVDLHSLSRIIIPTRKFGLILETKKKMAEEGERKRAAAELAEKRRLERLLDRQEQKKKSADSSKSLNRLGIPSENSIINEGDCFTDSAESELSESELSALSPEVDLRSISIRSIINNSNASTKAYFQSLDRALDKMRGNSESFIIPESSFPTDDTTMFGGSRRLVSVKDKISDLWQCKWPYIIAAIIISFLPVIAYFFYYK